VKNAIGLARLLDALAGPAWMAQAACAGSDPDMFFPQPGETTAEAKAVCAACPVRAQCADLAEQRHERFGIWGGLSERDRKRIRRQARHHQAA
jgi:WhiB family transcriptional regulator, redox-sensing transcriptional regulator